jgi:hypothetical protein
MVTRHFPVSAETQVRITLGEYQTCELISRYQEIYKSSQSAAPLTTQHAAKTFTFYLILFVSFFPKYPFVLLVTYTVSTRVQM